MRDIVTVFEKHENCALNHFIATPMIILSDPSGAQLRQMQMQKQAMDGQLIASGAANESAAHTNANANANENDTDHGAVTGRSSNGGVENEVDEEEVEEEVSPATAAARHEAQVHILSVICINPNRAKPLENYGNKTLSFSLITHTQRHTIIRGQLSSDIFCLLLVDCCACSAPKFIFLPTISRLSLSLSHTQLELAQLGGATQWVFAAATLPHESSQSVANSIQHHFPKVCIFNPPLCPWSCFSEGKTRFTG